MCQAVLHIVHMCRPLAGEDWVSDGQKSGTSGLAKRLEAIEIKLTGDLETKYDVYYRVHAQTYGWMNWAKNGEPAVHKVLQNVSKQFRLFSFRRERIRQVPFRLMITGRSSCDKMAQAIDMMH